MTNYAPKQSSTLEESGLRWEVLSHVDLAGGALTWLRILPAASDLTTAMLVKDLIIEETGVVAKLRICNTSREPILLPTDLVVDGVKQARVVERSVIVPAFAVAEIPVRCVEAGRWKARDEKTAASFSMTSPASLQSREHLAKLKQRKYKTTNATNDYALDQQEVWTHVTSELRKTRTTSDTQSYTAFLSTRAARLAEARRLDIQPPPCANALAVVRPNGGVWIEAFPTREAMGSIVATVIADVLEEPCAQGTTLEALRRADAAMQEIGATSLMPLPPSPATLGEYFALDGEDDVVVGQVLLFGNRVAHLVASVTLL
jgi:hypothetical protein